MPIDGLGGVDVGEEGGRAVLVNGHLIRCRSGVTDGPGALGGTHLIDAVAVGLDNLGPVRYGNARNPFSGLRVFDDAHQGTFLLDSRALYRIPAGG